MAHHSRAGRPGIDPQRHANVAQLLAGQVDDATSWCEAMVTFFSSQSGVPVPGDVSAKAYCSSLSPPAPSPFPSPSAPSPLPGSNFTKHALSFCATHGTAARRVYDQRGVSLFQCRSLCAVDVNCTCFDFDSGSGQECRFVEGQGVIAHSADGFDAYTRNAGQHHQLLQRVGWSDN
jgi:hypothetical protein